jgi:hypothetical protein
MEHRMSTLELKELSHPSGEVIKIAAGKTLDLKTQGNVTMPTGSVLQVVSATSGTYTITTSTSFVTTPLTASITPTSTSSKILVTVSAAIYAQSGGTYAARYTIFRGTVSGVNLGNTSNDGGTGFANIYNGSGNSLAVPMGISILDSPNTTSSQTYTVGMRSQGNSAGAGIMTENTTATITLTEIQG